MTASILVSGALFRAPERKTSSNGKSFIRATLKTQSSTDANGADFWSLLCFSETAGAELIELTDGDRLAVVGALKLELYQGRISRTIFVDRVLALRKQRKAKPDTIKPASNSEPDFNDPIGF
jgi:single-stranded DNA-binding protein